MINKNPSHLLDINWGKRRTRKSCLLETCNKYIHLSSLLLKTKLFCVNNSSRSTQTSYNHIGQIYLFFLKEAYFEQYLRDPRCLDFQTFLPKQPALFKAWKVEKV